MTVATVQEVQLNDLIEEVVSLGPKGKVQQPR